VTTEMHGLHQRLPVVTPVVLLAGVVGLSLVGGSIAAHAGGVLVALLFGQLAFHYADGTLWRLPRWVLLTGAGTAFAGLVLVTTLGNQPLLQLAEPTGYAAFAPSLAGVLLIGIVQLCLVSLPRETGRRALATSGPARAVAVVRTAPMTVYLVYLCAMLVVAGVAGVASAGGGLRWLAEPRTVFALGLIAMPTLLAFLWFERRRSTSAAPAVPSPTEEDPIEMPETLLPRSWADTLAASLGVSYGALGVLGFAVTGLTGWTETSTMLGLPIDPMANLIHLLVGWYLVHCVHLRTATRPGPWVVTAIACVPPMLTTVSGLGTAVHVLAMVGALAVAVAVAQPVRVRPSTAQPVPVGGGSAR
jgi:hypothetical protein